MAITPAEYLKNILVDDNVGVFAQGTNESDWVIFISKMPNEPNRAICLYDTGGDIQRGAKGAVWKKENVDIRVRDAGSGAYKNCYDKVQEIISSLEKVFRNPFNTNQVINVVRRNNEVFIGYDENERAVWSVNFLVNVNIL